jgi:pyruvate dehydrogenase E2 component (dihydrolipoamide acetyltransferase)
MALIEVKVPDIGDFDEVAVIELLVKPGDTVKAEQSRSSRGVRQGLDGNPVQRGRRGEGTARSSWATRSAKARWCWCWRQLGPPQRPLPGFRAKTAKPSVQRHLQLRNRIAAAAPAPAPATGPVEVRVPDIGDFKDVAVIEVFVKPGDTVKLEQSLITVESDKASMEIPSSAAGVIKELKVKLGDTVNIGDLLAILEGTGPACGTSRGCTRLRRAGSPPQQPSLQRCTGRAVATAMPAHNPTGAPVGLPHASPSVRKFARELGVPLDEVKGSGPRAASPKDRCAGLHPAVMAVPRRPKAQAAKAPAAQAGGGGSELGLIPWPKVDFTKFGPVERKELSRIKKISGANLLPQRDHDSRRHQP